LLTEINLLPMDIEGDSNINVDGLLGTATTRLARGSRARLSLRLLAIDWLLLSRCKTAAMATSTDSRNKSMTSATSASAFANATSPGVADLTVDGSCHVLSLVEAAVETSSARTLDESVATATRLSALATPTTAGMANLTSNRHSVVVASAQATVKVTFAGTTNETVAVFATRIAATLTAAICIALLSELGLCGASNAATSHSTAAHVLKGDLAAMRALIVLDVDACTLAAVRNSARSTNARKSGDLFDGLGVLLSVHALHIRECLNGRHLSKGEEGESQK